MSVCLVFGAMCFEIQPQTKTLATPTKALLLTSVQLFGQFVGLQKAGLEKQLQAKDAGYSDGGP